MDDAENSPVELRTERLLITLLPPSAAERMVRYHHENREHLAPWSPPNPPGFFSPDFWSWRLEENRSEYLEDRSCRFQLLELGATDGPVVGQLSFTSYTRGPHQSANLGYNVDHRFQGRGLMKEALRASIDFAFGHLGFHRLAANYMPTNERSGRILRSLGFIVEGYARDYLFLAGAWRDHVLTALYSPDPSPPGVRAFAGPPSKP
jgi:[ribosomal protein S5]-alanine N-acetyltransferase